MEEYKNFNMISDSGSSFNRIIHATIDVYNTTGSLWWKNTTVETREVVKKATDFWFFADTGKYTKGFEVDAMLRSWDSLNEK